FWQSISAWGSAAPVYLVIGSDSAIWNAGTTVDVTSRHPHYPQDLYSNPSSVSYKVMETAFRNAFKDSFGQPLKLTWWMHGGNIYRDADNLNVPIPNTMTLYLMKKYHGASIAQLGDELSLHYHTFFWSDYNGDGKFYWNQSKTYHESREDFDVTVAQYLLDEGIFPVSFRSGWHYMDNEWQQELDELLPYNLHNASPRKSSDTIEPLDNILDWSQATTNFVPFHPSPTNYQRSGTSKSWTVRSIKMLSLAQTDLNQVFARAAGGTSQVACLWGHLPESFLQAITNMASFVSVASSNYPSVQFRYCTAVEAMQRWQNSSDLTPPQLDVTQTVSNQTVTLTIQTSEPIFQPRPYVAMRDAFQQYSNLTSLCVPTGSNTWSLVLPIPKNLLAKVGVAVTDESGNTTNRILRFLPDDLYLDTSDSGYAELQGTWSSTTSTAWGTNARIAVVNATNTVRARWALPITRSGIYNVSLQVPALTNRASNAVFHIVSGTSNIMSVSFPERLPTNQWVFIGAPLLDAAQPAFVEMIVSNSPNSYALANVLRVVPVPDSNAPVAFPRGFATSMNQPITLAVGEIIGPGYDPDGDALKVSADTTSAQGGSIGMIGSSFVYSPATNFTGIDSFNYILDDNRGGATSATVQVLVISGTLPMANHVTLTRTANKFLIRFAGTPGARYSIQRSADLVNWTTLATMEAPVFGIIEREDDGTAAAATFYRIARE
ncbi:MAG: hypothetical protein JWM16_1287, partial [Verrucomicrobiales bacterium]|nr:hypothetical protein [Verrucomicrobiales bacterium]